MVGAWTMTDTGEFVLDPVIEEHKKQAFHLGRLAWQDAVWDYVSKHTGYDKEFLQSELVRRSQVDENMGTDLVDELLIEAFEGTM